ncbi:hypothetical protein ACXET9_11580 [Brachybacterium sp. DNPG3]
MSFGEAFPLLFIGALLLVATVPVLVLLVKFCTDLAALGAERAGAALGHGGASARH